MRPAAASAVLFFASLFTLGSAAAPGCECTGRTWDQATLTAKGMPPEWGTSCLAWEDGDSAAHTVGSKTDCKALWPTLTHGEWCCKPWCYVNKNTCSLPTFESLVKPGAGQLYYSYAACEGTETKYSMATCPWQGKRITEQ
eukprot:gene47221-51236_t